jgi:hypothetical protein
MIHLAVGTKLWISHPVWYFLLGIPYLNRDQNFNVHAAHNSAIPQQCEGYSTSIGPV